MEELKHRINGKKVDGSGRTLEIIDPSQGKAFRQIKCATASDVNAAVQAAKNAFPAWSEVPTGKRIQIMFKFRELILRDMDQLARLVSTEHGKTLDDAKGSITRGLEVVEFCCGMPSQLMSSYSQSVANGVDTFNVRQALGVCAGITPFNFPAMVPMWMFPVAISCGNTFVLKPSERDPSTALKLADLLEEAGLPPGVMNVVVGDKESVDTLLEHPDVEAISFVGSTAVGEYIYHKGTSHNKRVQALCGAKNHMIVMPDADMEQVADALMGAAYGSAGERCMAISVAVAVGDKAADEIVKRMSPRIKALRVGAYDSPGIEMGPVITKQSLEKIRGYIDSGLADGAKLVVDGRDLKVLSHENGFFLGGCLFDHVKPNMKIYKEEIFGPVLSLVRAKNFDEALKLVNDHEYGNGTAIFTRDGDTAREFALRAKIGMVGVNVPIPVPVAYHSFGGWKRSLFGDHSIHGAEGVRFYTRLKTVTSRWPSGIRQGAAFNFVSGAE